MNTPLAYLHGKFVPFTDAALPLHDAGFVSGATVVDNARTFRHKLFRWPDHLARFRRDCQTCYVPLEFSDEQLTATAEELVAHNANLLPPGGELQLVMFATPGPLGVYLGEPANGPPTLGMVTYPLPFARYRRFFTEGVTLSLAGSHGNSSESILSPTVKHRSRMVWHIADYNARTLTKNPAALSILLDSPSGAFTETSVANFLAVVDGVVTSPPHETILDGISLRVTRELCDSIGIPFAEARLPLSKIQTQSEAMLTGTGFCLAGVREMFPWLPKPHRYEWPGPMFRKLLAAWSDLVGVNIEQSFTDSPR
ncbi:MAG: aminotransferase class IV [Planctomycetes bacterium]|nr:aminotransferase class IV [Planctomycetota bacterium]